MPAYPLTARGYVRHAATPLLGAMVAVMLATCHPAPEEPAKTCLPAHLVLDWDSVAFTYSADHRLTSLQYWRDNALHEQYLVTYDDAFLDQCTHLVNGVKTESFTFIYGQPGKPTACIRAQADETPVDSMIYSHDGKGHLAQVDLRWNGILERRTRYEYYDRNNTGIDYDNVHKMFYQTGNGREKLRIENLLFDRWKRFFASSPDLALIETYLLEAEPSVNNVLQFHFYYPSDSIYYAPMLYEYYAGYNPDTLITDFIEGFTINPPLAQFRNVSYTCY